MRAKKLFLKGTPMILVSFFFSHRALSIGIGRDGIGLKVTEIAQTDKQTNIAHLGLPGSSGSSPGRVRKLLHKRKDNKQRNSKNVLFNYQLYHCYEFHMVSILSFDFILIN